jgi:stress-induced morphogen
MPAHALHGFPTFHILRQVQRRFRPDSRPIAWLSARFGAVGQATIVGTGDCDMAMDASEIERLIKARIPDAEVTIRDLAGDGDHYAATVLAESFRGKSRVQQHQIVYEALKAEMGGKLHALALQTGTPER